MTRQQTVPSLLKESFNNLLNNWKNIPCGAQSKTDTTMSLFDLYEAQMKSESGCWSESSPSLYPLSKKNADCLFALASNTFCWFRNEFLRDAPYPLLSQFAHRLKALEFKGMKPAFYFSNYAENRRSDLGEFSFEENFGCGSCRQRPEVEERKGLFRNLRQKPFCSANVSSLSPNIASIFYTNLSDVKASFSLVPNRGKRKGNPAFKESKEFSSKNKDKSIRKVALFHSCREKCVKPDQFFFNCLTKIYKAGLFLNCNISSLSEESLCFIWWIFRREKIWDEISATTKDVSTPLILLDELKLGVIWHSIFVSDFKSKNSPPKVCSSKNSKKRSKNPPKYSCERSRAAADGNSECEIPLVEPRETNEDHRTKRNENYESTNEETTKTSSNVEIQTRESNWMEATRQNRSESCHKEMSKSNRWQPFVINKEHLKPDSSSKPKEEFKRTELMSTIPEPDFVSLSSRTKSEDGRRVDSCLSSNTMSLDDNTLDDITLPDSLHADDASNSYASEGTVMDTNTKINLLRANHVATNIPLNNSEDNVLRLKPLPFSKPTPPPKDAHHLIPFDLSRVFQHLSPKGEKEGPKWHLKRIPSEIFKEKSLGLETLKTSENLLDPYEEKQLVFKRLPPFQDSTKTSKTFSETFQVLKIQTKNEKAESVEKCRGIADLKHFSDKGLQRPEVMRKQTKGPLPFGVKNEATQTLEVKKDDVNTQKSNDAEFAESRKSFNQKDLRFVSERNLEKREHKRTFQDKEQQTDSSRAIAWNESKLKGYTFQPIEGSSTERLVDQNRSRIDYRKLEDKMTQTNLVEGKILPKRPQEVFIKFFLAGLTPALLLFKHFVG